MNTISNSKRESNGTRTFEVKRGEIWLARLKGNDPHNRDLVPVLIVQNDKGNKYSTTTICLMGAESNLVISEYVQSVNWRTSYGIIVLKFNCLLLSTIDKKRLVKQIAKMDSETMLETSKKLNKVFGIGITILD
ncbi:type II toxin-antitoxin system PemK/MazF family toxin [Calidifontibacillus oryziterrae]|uniref:type II toxin-antitoxin system PemK/MazF family toxin n=1 Tax=Calidifontibacillus oryziterrae TaxID=1191699 RepID=UPI0002DECD42|nr:type II toxin-antitoxin system PemK/MazF family toxin [Calidifontibacillus oryziterrae]